jgi:hypothetical protein
MVVTLVLLQDKCGDQFGFLQLLLGASWRSLWWSQAFPHELHGDGVEVLAGIGAAWLCVGVIADSLSDADEQRVEISVSGIAKSRETVLLTF